MGEVEDVWVPFLRVHSLLVRKLEQELLDSADVTLSVYDVLIQLRLAGGELELTELSKRLLISNSGVTRLIDRMEKRQLVTRQRSIEDRRRVSAVLTGKGKRLEKRASRVHWQGIHAHFLDRLTAKEKASLARVMGKLRQSVED